MFLNTQVDPFYIKLQNAREKPDASKILFNYFKNAYPLLRMIENFNWTAF